LLLVSPKVTCDFETPWYLRFVVNDQPGIIAGLAAILSAHGLNIDAVLQKPGFEKASLPFVITLKLAVTHNCTLHCKKCPRCPLPYDRAFACRSSVRSKAALA
jgi:glycine cleavage system regulatory protein